MSRLHIEEDDDEEIVEVRFPKAIFNLETAVQGEPVPEGFDAVRIPIDGRLQADLSWKEAHAQALIYAERGLSLFWDIDLGLFNQLCQPISNQSQFLSLSLSLEHFRDTLWKDFRSCTAGLCLYRGALEVPLEQDISPPRSTLYSSRAAAEYLNLLVSRLPDTLKCFALIDLQRVVEPYLAAQILNKEFYKRLHLAVNKWSEFGADFLWDSHLFFIQPSDLIKTAICLPSSSQMTEEDFYSFNKIFMQLESQQVAVRVIPEAMLTMEWGGLDYLMTQSNTVTSEGRRKLCGFCAAGGTVVVIGSSLGLSQEMPITEFIRSVECLKS